MSAERQTLLPGWQRKRLSDLYAAPSRNGLYKSALHYGDGHQMVHMPQMFRGPVVDLSDAARVRVSLVELNRFGLQEGDLLFARRSLTLEGAGQCSLVPPLSHPATFESSIIRVRIDQHLVSPRYANFFLGSEIGFRRRLPFIRQVAVSGVSAGDVAAILIDFPSLLHQQKITAILATVDEAIEQTEALVQKWQQMKAGLMHDLFTRGVTSDGQLRATREEVPQFYKQSPLGWIPKEWEVATVGSCLVGIDAGKSPDCPETPASGDQWGLLKVGAVQPDGLRESENKTVMDDSLKNPAFLVREGDVLLSRANTFELVGMVCHVMSAPRNLMLSDKTLRLQPNLSRITRRFLALSLQGATARRQIENAATGTSGSMKNIGQGSVKAIWIVRPKTDEQIQITERIDALSEIVSTLKANLAKLHAEKQGLMQDLLTGRVRITQNKENPP